MRPAPERSALEIHHRKAVIVAAAVLATLPLYALAVELFPRGEWKPLADSRPDMTAALRFSLYGAAVAAVALLRILRGVILRKRPGEDPSLLGRRLFLASVLTSALSEVPVLLGLVLFLAAGLKRDFTILAAVSLVLMFMFFPRLGAWREWAAGP